MADLETAIDVEEEVKEVTANCLGIDSSVIKSESRIGCDLGGSSLDAAGLCLALSSNFDVTVSVGDFKDKCEATQEQIIAAVRSKLEDKRLNRK